LKSKNKWILGLGIVILLFIGLYFSNVKQMFTGGTNYEEFYDEGTYHRYLFLVQAQSGLSKCPTDTLTVNLKQEGYSSYSCSGVQYGTWDSHIIDCKMLDGNIAQITVDDYITDRGCSGSLGFLEVKAYINQDYKCDGIYSIGEAKCVGNALYTCGTNGWIYSDYCINGCENGQCKSAVCGVGYNFGDRRCKDSKTVEWCDHTGWQILQTCSGNYECIDGTCVDNSQTDAWFKISDVEPTTNIIQNNEVKIKWNIENVGGKDAIDIKVYFDNNLVDEIPRIEPNQFTGIEYDYIFTNVGDIDKVIKVDYKTDGFLTNPTGTNSETITFHINPEQICEPGTVKESGCEDNKITTIICNDAGTEYIALTILCGPETYCSKDLNTGKWGCIDDSINNPDIANNQSRCIYKPLQPCLNAIWLDYPDCIWDDSKCSNVDVIKNDTLTKDDLDKLCREQYGDDLLIYDETLERCTCIEGYEWISNKCIIKSERIKIPEIETKYIIGIILAILFVIIVGYAVVKK